QRAKGVLELAASLYESSLSSESWRAAEGVLQTDSRLGNALKLSLRAKSNDRKGISLSFATGGFREIRELAEGKLSLAWVNPSVCLTMAYRGKGPFPKRLPLRTIAVFPSYDVMGFAVHDSTGVTSLTQIKKERFPLKLSTRLVTQNALKENSTMFTVAAVMPANVAYAICEAIDKRKEFIPTDNYKPLDIAQLCANDEEAPYDVPLHPGAERFYRERGYLK